MEGFVNDMLWFGLGMLAAQFTGSWVIGFGTTWPFIEIKRDVDKN